jgi:flagellar basal-body rod protein FlgG
MGAALLLLLPGCITNRGSVSATDRPLDLAIDGDGFFVVQTQQGGYLFTRKGDLFISVDNRLVNGDGYALAPIIKLPADLSGVDIAANGQVSARRVGEDAAQSLGYIKLAKFPSPQRLTREDNYLAPSEASGEPTTHRPGTGGVGLIRTKTLEK